MSEDAPDSPLLYGSESLTREENELRNELKEWCKAKLRRGYRPIPLWVALSIVSDMMKDPDSYGLR